MNTSEEGGGGALSQHCTGAPINLTFIENIISITIRIYPGLIYILLN